MHFSLIFPSSISMITSMKYIHIVNRDVLPTTLFLLILFGITNLSSEEMSVQKEENILQKVANSCCFFSSNFYKVLSDEFDGNIITSPLSLHTILSLLHHGSKGVTSNELQTVLYPSSIDVSHNEIKSLISILNDIKEVELQVANAIYMQDNFQILSEFTTVSKDVFNCGLSIINFKNKLQAINEINTWVKKATRDKISTILSNDDIDEDTKAILINAVYFKARWLHKFDDKLIKNIFFHTSKTEKKLVPMMYKRSKYIYGEISNLNARFIEIPYINQDIAMIILLPNEINGLEFLEKNFKWEDFSEASRNEIDIELSLPRFKYEITIDLENILRKMGLHSIFEDTADFGNLTNEPVKISKILQKAFIEVNEEGSEAAAATVAQIRLKRALIDFPEEFLVNRPFLFIIYHKPSKIPIFFGSVKDINIPVEKDEL
ncbi:leukocyte elastase inhibitor-like isoform X1 [Vespa mandarinia]|uniref:leukocyte elastase inhibitor-like isoform X1 n=2 Tax=Vespa mandarinia TaxID=7446 RepID=UPI00160E9955|nr:leukocyte elastase inhibitor-like isoform X1 [Vespa mandarinia]